MTPPTKRSSDFIAHLEQLDRLFGPQPGRQAKPVVLVEDNGPIHTSKRSLAALAARAHWLTVEWLPKYAPELNEIEPVWRDLKAHHLAHQTFTDVNALDLAIHDAVIDLTRAHRPSVAPCQETLWLSWYGSHYNRPAWTLMHRRWMAGLRFEQAAHHIVLEDCIAQSRRRRRGEIVWKLISRRRCRIGRWPQWCVPASAARDGSGGGGDGSRGTRRHHPLRQSAPADGVSGSGSVEHSSGGTRRQGGITKAGNGAARRMLIEAAWSYRFPARISREQLLRQEGWPSRSATPPGRRRSDCVGAIASSPGRENRRQWSPTAIARELAGFVWAIAKHVKPLNRDARRSKSEIAKRRSSTTTLLSKAEQGWRHGHGQENPRVHYQPDIFRRWRPRQRKLRDASPVRRYPTRASEHDQPSF